MFYHIFIHNLRLTAQKNFEIEENECYGVAGAVRRSFELKDNVAYFVVQRHSAQANPL